MLRFAPTSSEDMNVCDLRIALFNYIIAKQMGEEFIVRIEDTNNDSDSKNQEILDLLSLFGIEYSQVVYQSQNLRFHSAMALQLVHEKKAFSCFCSDEWLDKKKAQAKEANQPYRYDDACRNLPPELVIDNTNPFSIRIKKPDRDTSLDSLVIMDRDKKPTWDFASAVDDMLSDISFVVRDEKYITNTQKQIHIRNSLEYNKDIKYTHIPTILKAQEFSIKRLLEDGFLPEAISNYLISTQSKSPYEVFNIVDAVKDFKLEDISNSPAHFSLDALKEINKKHLQNLDAVELSRYVGFADAEIGEVAKIYLDDIYTTKDLKKKIEAIFTPKQIPQEFKDDAKKFVDALKDAPYFENYDDFKKYIIENSTIQTKNFSEIFSYLLTGSKTTPNIEKVYGYLKNYIGEIIK